MKALSLFIALFSISIFVKAQNTIILITDKSQSKKYTKISSLAFQMKVKIQVNSDQPFNENSLGIIYTATSISGEDISNIRNYVKKGGRVALFYTALWEEQNSLLQDLLNISISAEEVFDNHKGSFLYPINSLPSFLQNYKIMCLTNYEAGEIWGFLTTLGEGTEYNIISTSSGKSRCVSYEYQIGKGKILFLPKGFGHSLRTPNPPVYAKATGCFLEDFQVDASDNTEGAQTLIAWFNK